MDMTAHCTVRLDLLELEWGIDHENGNIAECRHTFISFLDFEKPFRSCLPLGVFDAYLLVWMEDD
jgi:hypothetical protein